MESRYSNILSIFLVIAIVVIIGILAFFGYKVYKSDETTKKAEDAVTEFDSNTGNTDNTNQTEKPSEEDNPTEPGTSLDDIINNFGNIGNTGSIYDQSGNSKDTYYDGYKVIGIVSIPSINIEYPILEENTSATLKIAIVAVHPKNPGNAVNKEGNLVLWGHNYKNGTFFSDIGKLTTGAKIYIKDTTGTKIEYQVYNSYETTDSDMTYATRNTDGAREITLSTCANESGKRTIVWARET